jgi:hypothetical protein
MIPPSGYVLDAATLGYAARIRAEARRVRTLWPRRSRRRQRVRARRPCAIAPASYAKWIPSADASGETEPRRRGAEVGPCVGASASPRVLRGRRALRVAQSQDAPSIAQPGSVAPIISKHETLFTVHAAMGGPKRPLASTVLATGHPPAEKPPGRRRARSPTYHLTAIFQSRQDRVITIRSFQESTSRAGALTILCCNGSPRTVRRVGAGTRASPDRG